MLFECFLSQGYKHLTNVDEWGSACVLTEDEKLGVEYNYCRDDGYDESAMYLMKYNESEKCYDRHYSNYVPYRIDWERTDWRKQLQKAMENFLIAVSFQNQ